MSTLDVFDEKIKQNGFTIIEVLAGKKSPSFCYTVGLTTTYNHPEIITFGLPHGIAERLITDAIEKIIEDEGSIVADFPYEDLANFPIEFIPAKKENLNRYMYLFGNHYPDKEPEAFQMLWTDTQGHFPYEKDYDDKYKAAQPLLF